MTSMTFDPTTLTATYTSNVVISAGSGYAIATTVTSPPVYGPGSVTLIDPIARENELAAMREKYPTLKQAYDHYQIILRMCDSQERMERK